MCRMFGVNPAAQFMHQPAAGSWVDTHRDDDEPDYRRVNVTGEDAFHFLFWVFRLGG